MRGFNWVGALIAFVLMEGLGYLWYGPLFGATWTKALGHAPDMAGGPLALAEGAVVTLVIIVGLDWLIRRLGSTGLMASLSGAFLAWLFFDLTTMAVDYIYE